VHDRLWRQPSVGIGVDQMHSQGWMSFGDAADLVEIDRVLSVCDRVEEVDAPVEQARRSTGSS
jgi:hypothetical protein